MASITGGNALAMATIAMILMFVVLLVFAFYAFDLGRFVSISSSSGLKVALEREEPTPSSSPVAEVPELDAEETRQLLGFIDYPVVRIQLREESIFSPGVQEHVGRLSEVEIQRRCAFISIDFNRDRCVRAERVCAESISSDQEHWACLNRQDVWIGRPLAY